MPVSELTDVSKLCIHTITTKPWPLQTAVKKFAARGLHAITVWRQALEGIKLADARRILDDAGMEVVSLCRGGFFPSTDVAARKTAIEDNRRAIEAAAEIGAPLIVLVCGADPGQSLAESRKQIQDGIEFILPYAKENNIKLAIEPLHPMYADDRSAINTLKQANDMCERINDPDVGVTVDVYHLWWDETLETEISRCGENKRLFSFHISDWKTPTTDLLLDRGLMGEGCIPLRKIRGWIEASGFGGYHEVEIFSNHYWESDQDKFLDKIVHAYLKYA